MFILRSDITHYYYRIHGTQKAEGSSFNWFPRFAVPTFLWFHAQKTSNTYWFGIAIVYRFPNIIIRHRQMHASRSWNPKRKLKCIFCCCIFFCWIVFVSAKWKRLWNFPDWMIHYFLSFTKIHLNDIIHWMNLILVKVSNTALGQCSKIDARISFISFKNLTMHWKTAINWWIYQVARYVHASLSLNRPSLRWIINWRCLKLW